nr:amino acid adenylation domain-containing protein [Lachnospiraceae bacterium]
LGINTDLYGAGLSSIGCIRFCALLTEKFGVNYKVPEIFENRTVKDIEELTGDKLSDSENGAVNYELRDKYPLSMTQTGIYIECERYPDTTIYNIPELYTLDPSVDTKRLEDAVITAVKAHPYLLMQPVMDEEHRLHALRRDEYPFKVRRVSCKELPAEDKLVRPFDLKSGEQLFRAEIYETEDKNYFFFDTHHIVSDGGSIDILINNIERAYQGETVSKENYTGYEFALDEETARKSSRLEKARSWYDGIFRGCGGETLPGKDGNPDAPHIAFHRIYGEANGADIRKWCEDNSLTYNAFFTSAFGLALTAYTCSEQAVFCTIYNGRNDVRLENSVSMLVKTMPVFLSPDKDKKVEEYTVGCQNYLLSAMSNDIFSFAEIRKAYDIKADILFAFQGDFEHGAVIGGKNASLTMLGLSHARAPLGVDITFDGNSVVYEIEYDPTLFSEYTVRGLITMTDTVASQMLIKEKIGDIALVTDREKEKIQNLYDSSYPVEERPAYRLLQDASDKYPDRKALVAVDRTLTFRELNEEANAIGHVLAGLGAGPESIVAVLAQRNSHAYVMRQGVLKSGGAFLPIDPEYPEDRIRFILEDSGARLLVTTKDVLTERKTFFDELATTGITIVEEGTAVNKGNRENLNVSVPYESLAYVIYTSGSTGRPKGVMLTNKNLVNFVDDNEKNHEIQGYTKRGHVSLAIAALTFDFSIMEEFVPIANGLTVVLATHDQIMNPVMLAQAMLDNDVDVMSCTPSYLMNLLDMGEYTDIFNRAVKKLKSVDMGAEAFPPALFDKLKAVNPDIYIMNGYGPTEATISCTMQVIENTDDITIGIPNVNVSVCTIDRDLRLQPMGALGEMVIVGDGIGRGYIGRDDLTAKSFITMFGKPAYRSGDLVRLKEDGNIEFHGRIDNQVKLRGLRVELGEIESVINTYPGVRSSIVIVVKQETEYLAAYFTADNRVDLSDLKTHLAAKLTEYMVPQVFMQLDEMPLTANGKIDKKALPQAGLVEDKITEPENEMQEEITGAVKEVLGDVRFGVDSDLFGAGLSSIGCIRLCAILSGRFEVNILISDIFDNKTVREIESLIYEKRDNEVQDYTIREEYPLTMTQMGIFVESIKFTGSTVYNIPYLYKLDVATDMMRLKSAVEKALTAHPYIFMTLRRTEDDEVVAVRKNAGEITVNVPVESVLPPKDELVRPYDLISGEALYRISLYDTKDGKYIFIDLHHIIADGESFDILLSDIDSAYNGEEPDTETYTGYEAALDEKNARRSGKFKTAKNWLESTFSGCSGISVPGDRGVIAEAENIVPSIAPDSVYEDEHIGTVKYTGLAGAEKVRDFCSEHDLTENAFFTAAFGLALKIYTGLDDAVFTTIYNGRSDPRTLRSIAMYVKTLPVILSLKSSETTVGAVDESRSLLLNAMANDVVSFSEIRTEYGIDSDVLFAYQGDLGTSSVETPYTGEKIKIGEGNAEEIELSLSQAKALFGLDISLKGNGIVYEFEYAPSAYRRETMDSFVSLLDHIVSLLITKDKLSEIINDVGVRAFIPEKALNKAANDKAAKGLGTSSETRQGAGNWNTAGSEDLIQEFCEIFKKVLSLDKVERDSDFFKLGGTSLTAAKVMMASMSRNLPVVYQDVFDNPTPEKLAIMVEEKQRAEFGSGNTAGEAAVEMDLRAVSKGENGPLAHNCDEYLDRIALGHGEYRITGNVVVTGAAGFLGIHVLKELLESDAPEIYCLINGRGEDAKEKLKQTFFYYFEGAHNEELDKRITVVDGDITSPESLVELEKYDFIMLINCAACVKHFAKADMMKQVNVYGVGNLADLCIKKGAKLIHVSTTSIAGDCVGEGNHPEVLDETRLSMGQEVESNIYVYTKYLAEKLVIDAVEKKGLDAKIMRVGNLMSRHEDGEFQINFETNNFMNTLRAYQVLGCYPVDLMHEQDEFSPIDEVARAILLLASTPSEFTVFHPYNSHSVEMGDIVYAMNNAGINIDIVERSEFDTRLKEALADDNKNRYVSPLVNYDLDDDERRVENGADNIFTVRALYRLGFKWSLTDAEYIRHSIEMLDSLDFFEDLV